MFTRPLMALVLAAGVAGAQEAAPQPAGVGPLSKSPQESGDYLIAAGTRVPLSLINSISTKHSLLGDRVYLETAFPVLANGRIAIPVGSWVAGTVTQIKKPGRVKGRGELYVRFDTLTLPNGVTRDFRSRMGSMDGDSKNELDRTEGKVKGEGNKAGDLKTIGEATAVGASIGGLAGNAAGHAGEGLGIGAAAGAAAGILGILATRGPDAVLAKGTTIEMILDRNLTFTESDLNFGTVRQPRMAQPGTAATESKSTSIPIRKTPF